MAGMKKGERNERYLKGRICVTWQWTEIQFSNLGEQNNDNLRTDGLI